MQSYMLNLYMERANEFCNWLSVNIISDYIILNAEFYKTKEHVPFKRRKNATYRKITEGEKWGENWDSAWFRLSGTIPEKWKRKEIVAQLDFNGEGLVFKDDNPLPLQGITNGSVFKENLARDIVRLFPECRGNENVELWVEAAANGLFGLKLEKDPPENSPIRYGCYYGIVNKIRLCVWENEIWLLWRDICVLLNLARTLPDESVRKKRIVRNIGECIDYICGDLSKTKKARSILKKELTKPAYASELEVYAVGHAHIDTAWLWPVKETIRKCARTFSSQINLINRYPGYVFGASQAQHYAFVKQYYPELYDKIKEKIKSGQWEVQGGMWVEADCNLISGESMIRQFLHGKNFFKDEFGIDVNNLWLPDVFGYSAALPQILKKSGIEFFVTQKISWNLVNTFPHHTFKWRGIDGSEVIAHFPPENSYNSNLEPKILIEGRNRFAENDFIHGFLSLFGVGNGGGGPTEEYIENGLRQKDMEGSPKVIFSHAQYYLDSLKRYEYELETWIGELYLEVHRGTLTTQALVKKLNRKLEFMLKNVEILSSCLNSYKNYPSKEMDSLWKMLLINQFHDIIPGSSIRKVYENTHQEYSSMMLKCDELIKKAARSLFRDKPDAMVLVNLSSFDFNGYIKLPPDWNGFVIKDIHGNMPNTQKDDHGLLVSLSIPSYSMLTLYKLKSKSTDNLSKEERKEISASTITLENEFILYEFNQNAQIVRIYDKEADKEILDGKGAGNLLSLYDDHPHNWDAWDIDIYYENSRIEEAYSTEAPEIIRGNVGDQLKFTLKIGNSDIIQKIFLSKNSKRLDFDTYVNWREKHRMLRVSFPVNILNGKAKYDIQYGFIERPNNRNTSWDVAKFEVCGHKYADLSNEDYGVALLNDSKYGYKILDNVIDLNLLRSPTNPDPDADIGEHSFTYSLFPHKGDLIRSHVIEEAYLLNNPPLIIKDMETENNILNTPCSIKEGNGVSLEIIKKAEKEDCFVIRLVELYGKNSNVKLKLLSKYKNLVLTNLMEWDNIEEYSLGEDNSVNLRFSPFEIKTLKVW